MNNQSLKRQIQAQMMAQARAERQAEEQAAYSDFKASQLYCPKCKAAMPVKQRQLLVLPDGDLFDYVCAQCGTSLGTRKS